MQKPTNYSGYRKAVVDFEKCSTEQDIIQSMLKTGYGNVIHNDYNGYGLSDEDNIE